MHGKTSKEEEESVDPVMAMEREANIECQLCKVSLRFSRSIMLANQCILCHFKMYFYAFITDLTVKR